MPSRFVRIVVTAVAILATAALPAVVHGQAASPSRGADSAADSAPRFRRGQWGAEFTLRPQVSSVGILRFRSAQSAWLAALSLSAVDTKVTAPDTVGVLHQYRSFQSGRGSVRVGYRRYRSLGDRTMGALTMGVVGGASREYRRFSDGGAYILDTSKELGGFAELGAGYHVTRHLALGASAALTAQHSWFETRPWVRQRTQSTSIDLADPVLRLTLLF